MQRVGFIIDGMAPSWRRPGAWPGLLRGFRSGSSVAEMRFRWIARWVNTQRANELRYELYRPWQRYDMVLFLKSMGGESEALARRLRRQRVPTVFDCNVDYFTPAAGTFYYTQMAPTEAQRSEAMTMAGLVDGIIADSSHIARSASRFHSRVVVLEDNVRDDLLANGSDWQPANGPLPLLWCGEACKMFDLLRIRDVLVAMADRMSLRVVTNALSGMDLIYPEYRRALADLLGRVPHEIVPFENVEQLLALYDKGGVFLSPRFLDNTYNPGHTEWKITLAMARGRLAVCSEQPSYVEVNGRSYGRGCWICRDEGEWRQALERLVAGRISWREEQQAACEVVRRCYATSLLAARHAAFLKSILES